MKRRMSKMIWGLGGAGLALAAGLAGADPTAPAAAPPAGPTSVAIKPMRIAVSMYPLAVAALNVAGAEAGVTVETLDEAHGGCPHGRHLTPGDIQRLAAADVLILNGAGLDAYLDKALEPYPRLAVIRTADGLDLMRDAGGANPHVWVSPALYQRQVEAIAAGLARADPARAGRYQANAAAYIGRLEALRERMRAGLTGLSRREIVTFHAAFAYFAREFDLAVAAVIELEPGVEPSARDLAEIIRTVRRAGIRALFAEPQYPARVAETVAAETGAKVYILDPVASGPLLPDAYLRIMERNLDTLQRALK